MGLLVDGVWRDEQHAERTPAGRFVRPATRFRNWVTEDGSAGPTGEGGFAAARGRYHLYVALACPWAHRTIIMRTLKGLEDVVSMSVVEPLYGPHGWRFGTSPGTTPDSVNGASELAEIYLRADPKYTGRVSVPALWDKERRTIVNNESPEIIRMLNGAFGRFTNVRTDYYPEALRGEIDRVNTLVYENINNGVYRAGFATAQEAYEDAFRAVFAALDEIEAMLARQRYLAGAGDHRGGLAAVPDARSLRRGLLQPFQMQPAPDRRLSESVELSARPLPAARRRRDREHGSHQAALLRQPAPREPDRHRAGGSRARLSGAA